MKKTNLLLLVICSVLLFSSDILSAQENSNQQYLTVTTLHWNMDLEDFSMEEWKAVEKEFLNKVTLKNDHVLATTTALHFMTADNTEVLYVQLYNSWNDIDLSNKKNEELVKEAWPDEVKRKAFFKKKDGYYSARHSDEIYAAISGAKLYNGEPDAPMLYYVRKSHLAFPEDGTKKEFEVLRNAFVTDVIHKNKYIKAYYPYVHAWGADRRDFVEVFAVESLDAIDKLFNEQERLNKARFDDDSKMKSEGKKSEKYFTGFHADYVYRPIQELAKKMKAPK
ncbi:MAG: hypothetical protein ACPG45_02815 [Flavobacteriaceae bacterium]